MPLARVDGSRLMYQAREYWQMIKLNNQKLEKQIQEILQNSRFASVEEYLIYAACRDWGLARKRKL